MPATPATAYRAVLLDIEGTICPISFVKDVLFPYALRALPDVLKSEWDSPEFARYRDAFPAAYAASETALASHVEDLTARDVKAPYLKSLQGYLWERGYRTGELRAPLFADVAPKIETWRQRGVAVLIYSSGSVPAQKLLLGHTNAAPPDLTPAIAGFFDTVNAGPKTEPASYDKIARKHAAQNASQIPPGEWLFLSDNVAEVEAAKLAGMQSIVIQRPGNAPLPAVVNEKHEVIRDFDELDE